MSIGPKISLLVAVLASSAACASFSSLHSETSIDAGQSFLLGGAQGGRFSATVKNTGPVPVEVFVDIVGTRRLVIVLAPDSTIDTEFQARETAVFSNTSSTRAVLKVDIRGGDARNLGMRYDSARRVP